MKANELRIGNWVINRFDKPYQIKSGYGLLTSAVNKYQSIPLTPEILEKAGFEDINDDGDYFLNGYCYHDNSLWFKTSAIDCLYLHQLQNLYYALTGEDLQIEL